MPENPYPFMRADRACVMPPGEYVVGDPSYVLCQNIRDEYYDRLRKSWAVKHQGPAFIIAGFMCLEFATTFGDGHYWGNDGYEYGVDRRHRLDSNRTDRRQDVDRDWDRRHFPQLVPMQSRL